MIEEAGSSHDIRIVSIGEYGRMGFVQRALQVADDTTSDLCIKALEDLVAATPSASAEVQLLCVVSRYLDYKIHTSPPWCVSASSSARGA